MTSTPLNKKILDKKAGFANKKGQQGQSKHENSVPMSTMEHSEPCTSSSLVSSSAPDPDPDQNVDQQEDIDDLINVNNDESFSSSSEDEAMAQETASDQARWAQTVSYTHLTLPTIYSV